MDAIGFRARRMDAIEIAARHNVAPPRGGISLVGAESVLAKVPDSAGWMMRHRLYIHLIWTTRDRERLIDCDVARCLCRFLRAMARKERAHILEIGMVQTHLHLLARIHPTGAVSTLVKRLKGASSAVATKEGLGRNGRLY